MKKKNIFIALALLATPVMAKEHIITSSEKLSAELGAGYSSESEVFTGKCVTGQPIYVGKQESNLDFSQSVSQKELSKELGISAGGRARMGAITYTASAKFMKNSKSNAFSISSIYTGNYSFRQRKLKDPQLNEIGKKLMNNPMRFQTTCGDNFSHKQSLGAKIFFSIRIDFTSTTAKQAFEANFSMSGPMASASASLKQAKNSFSKDTKVTVSALQIGGDVSKISDIFASSNAQGSKDFVSCSFGDLVKCEKVLEGAIEYATNTENGFPSQIRPDSDPNSATGPAVLKTYAYPYDQMGEYINFSPALTRAIKKTRQALNTVFESVFSQHHTTYTLINNGTIRLSPRQRNKFVQMETNLYDQFFTLAEGIEQCYDSPLECSDIYEELKFGAESGAKLYPLSEFEVEKEIFAQWCDFAGTPFSKDHTKTTVNKMIAVAKEISADSFAPAGAGLEVDTCYIAGSVLEKQSSLNLSSANISDLRPLSTLKGLTELDISYNEIINLAPLSNLKNLVTLNASGNKIADLNYLSNLINLSRLELADNEIVISSPLSKLDRIDFLDLRNNHIDVECPFSNPGICLIADYRYNNEFVPLSRDHLNLPSRWGHRVSKLKNGDLIVTGGSVGSHGTRIGVLSNYETEFYSHSNLVNQRSHHTATVLDSDEVLITGGWGANMSAEIFNHSTQSVATLPSMNHPRVEHAALKLDNGDVLITGGWKGRNQFWTGRDSQANAELFNAKKMKFESIGSMKVPRAAHTMTKLNDGRILIVGGFKVNSESEGEGLSSIEIYDPNFKKFIKIPSRLRNARGNHTATKLKDGRVLIAGGFSKENSAVATIEIFNPRTLTVELQETLMNEHRANHQAVLLPDGKVFLVGGQTKFAPSRSTSDACDTCSKTAEIYDPYTKLSTKTSSEMNAARAQFSATLSNDNRIIIIGGKGDDARFSASMFEFSKF
ncbi:kelch repeat-containing protein [Halobacteriovorax sp. HLS]|uniref:kelch repeat-containing protein n=1 Tax=Halobacteriovorax sp. HLS TaxID=2234000 RepID=UPI000FDC3D8D|nr:kelch repeat-containing protein [Halobacteriovorax sp. HLS]